MQTTDIIAPGMCFQRKPGVVLRQVAGEHMLVPTVTREVDLDCLCLLNATGVYVWEHLDGERSVEGLADTLVERYGISREVARADVVQFLANLMEHRLAERVDGNAS